MTPVGANLPVPETPSVLPERHNTRPVVAYELTDQDMDLLRAALPESARDREADCLAWWRELPGLLANGNAGRHALFEGGNLVSVWDTHNDAIQAGYDKFGSDRPFMTPIIEQQDLDRLRRYLIQERAKQCRN